MAEARDVKVRLIVDAAEFEAAVSQVAKLASKLTKALRDLSDAPLRVRSERSGSPDL